jgi:hypothetical protein
MNHPYREPFKLDTNVTVTVEKDVAECLKAMSSHMKISENEIVNTALRRYIATHSDFLPKTFKKKA